MNEPPTPMTPLQIKPMTVGEILSRSARLFQQNLALLVMVTFLPQAVLLLIETLIGDMAKDQPRILAVIIVVVVLMNAVALSAITTAVAGCVLGHPPTLRQTYGLTFRNKLLWVVMAYVATAMISLLGFTLVFAPALSLGVIPALFLGFIPTLMVGGYLAITIPVVVLESLPPLLAISRSFHLMREELPKGIAVFGFVVLISGVLPLMFQFAVRGGRFAPLLVTVVGSVTLPLAYTATVLLYLSVRSKEGYGLEQLAADLAQRVGK